ncbi:subtilisin-like protease [Metarhizium album ARSEF 1941]|uniref:Subtilisin-like protease n=1 Tax=Metarhizium album (strain ARSEF 1941) TaxID=1081103 RepID=A0A0B2WMR2_METAS|nr:subtilisin-like protease [Metarhizium album ARSEF 1941]KHN95228.1 subtilisin-like protease [Metarhizium album ARSEF 1941]
MIARVTFTSKNSDDATHLTSHAEAYLSGWSADGGINADTQRSVYHLNDHANVEARLFFQGHLGAFMTERQKPPKKIPAGSAEEILNRINSWADKFEKTACLHTYQYAPYLDRYETVPGFRDLPDSPQPPNYAGAIAWSLEVLTMMVKITEQKDFVQKLPSISEADQEKNRVGVYDVEERVRTWAEYVAANPTTAKKTAQDLLQKLRVHFKKYADLLRENGIFNKFSVTEKHKMVKGLTVKYGERPRDAVTELLDDSDDTNHDFYGPSVYLVPEYTYDLEEACTSFTAIVDDNEHEGLQNLSEGTMARYRYFKCEKAPNKEKIRHVMLFRGQIGEEQQNGLMLFGFNGWTGDINDGRFLATGRDELRLMWAYDELEIY